MKPLRDWNIVATILGRKGGPMKDTRSGRGGTRNQQQALLAEYEEDSREEKDDILWGEKLTKNEQH